MMNKVNLRNFYRRSEGKVPSYIKQKFRIDKLPPNGSGVGAVERQWSFRVLIPVCTYYRCDPMFLHLLVFQSDCVQEVKQSATARNLIFVISHGCLAISKATSRNVMSDTSPFGITLFQEFEIPSPKHSKVVRAQIRKEYRSCKLLLAKPKKFEIKVLT